MSNYSSTVKFLHKLYLSNKFISSSSFEVEESLFYGRAPKDISSKVFISGLARAGTTNFMRIIHRSEAYASLQYSNMPFLFLPNLWRNPAQIDTHERLHKDGIKIDGDSPEEFDEYFWKVFLKDSYIKSHLSPHKVDKEMILKFEKYISLICQSKGKTKYLTKNNNTILRLESLKKMDNATFFFLIRNPLDHASSLLKTHNLFCQKQKKDKFILDYFNYLGHHEFGLNHKPFLLGSKLKKARIEYELTSVNYWLLIWKDYYSHLLKIYDQRLNLILFEDIVNQPEKVYQHISEILNVKISANKKTYTPPNYSPKDINSTLLNECQEIYSKIKNKTQYLSKYD